VGAAWLDATVSPDIFVDAASGLMIALINQRPVTLLFW
jgi:hypothetical protein